MSNHTRTHADWIGRTVYGANGDKIGDITDIYADDVTGKPDWMTVSTGWFGTAEQFVPIAGSTTKGDDIVIAFSEDTVKDAPSVDGDEHLDADDERRLYSHYGMDFDADPSVETEVPRADEGYAYTDTRTAADRDATVVRSEEELSVDKVQRKAGNARLRKYVVTEDVSMTVPVRKEVAQITREKITDDGRGGTISDGETVEEITLTEEELIVDKNVVAKEKVGIETETVTEERQVSETLRKEQVESDGDVTND